MYTIKGYLKYAEIDDYKDGCQPESTSQYYDSSISFEGKTQKELVEKVKNFFGVDDDSIELNSCDDAGRIDIQITEDEDGSIADEHDIEKWKNGKKVLWLATYTMQAYKQESFKFDLLGEK